MLNNKTKRETSVILKKEIGLGEGVGRGKTKHPNIHQGKYV